MVMVWLSETGKYSKDLLHFLLPGMGKGSGGTVLRKDTCAVLGIAGKCVGRDGQG